MLLSILIPIYNLEKYIGNCLQSILKQNLNRKSYEILLIDDGSADASLEIIKSFEKSNSNITVYTQENFGKGVALKNGLTHAKGKYIYFMDGDDYLANDCLLQVLDNLETYNLDIIGFDVLETNSLNNEVSRFRPADEFKLKIQSGIEFLGSCPKYRVEIWWYIVKKSFLDESGLTFEDSRFVNDSYFTPNLFCKGERVSFLPLDVYRYVKRPDSITSRKNSKHFEKHIKDTAYAILKMQEIINSIPQEAIKTKLIITIKQESYVFFSIVRYMKSDLDFKYFKLLLANYRSLGVYPMKTMVKSEKYEAFVFRLLIRLFNAKLLLYPTVLLGKFFFKVKQLSTMI